MTISLPVGNLDFVANPLSGLHPILKQLKETTSSPQNPFYRLLQQVPFLGSNEESISDETHHLIFDCVSNWFRPLPKKSDVLEIEEIGDYFRIHIRINESSYFVESNEGGVLFRRILNNTDENTTEIQVFKSYNEERPSSIRHIQNGRCIKQFSLSPDYVEFYLKNFHNIRIIPEDDTQRLDVLSLRSQRYLEIKNWLDIIFNNQSVSLPKCPQRIFGSHQRQYTYFPGGRTVFFPDVDNSIACRNNNDQLEYFFPDPNNNEQLALCTGSCCVGKFVNDGNIYLLHVSFSDHSTRVEIKIPNGAGYFEKTVFYVDLTQ